VKRFVRIKVASRAGKRTCTVEVSLNIDLFTIIAVDVFLLGI